eukprot:m.58581 g.58581  ORF g.58581 m.58581 type:complete len:425 (-) comp11704_c1_seq1:593-1867(-)
MEATESGIVHCDGVELRATLAALGLLPINWDATYAMTRSPLTTPHDSGMREVALHRTSSQSSIDPRYASSTPQSTMVDEPTQFVWDTKPAPQPVSRPTPVLASRASVGSTPIQHLPNEVLLLIFSFLKPKDKLACALVCRRWKQWAFDPSLWQRIMVDGLEFDQPAALSLLERQPNVLSFRQSKLPPSLSLKAASAQSALHSLDLRDSTISDAQFCAIIQGAPNLVELDISNTPLTDKSVMLTGQVCSGLQSFSACMSDISNDAIRFVASHCPQLHTLAVGWMTRPLTPETIEVVCRACPDLKQVDISGSQRVLTDDALTKLAQQLAGLQVLDLSDCYGLTDEGMKALVKNCKQLRHLALSRCHHVTVAAMKSIARMPTLEAVDLFGCYTNVYPHIQAVCSHLRINSSILSPVHHMALSAQALC